MSPIGHISVRETLPHEPNNACTRHCHSCGVDQLFTSAWEWCDHCGHGFRTERELLDTHRHRIFTDQGIWAVLKTFRMDSALITRCPLCLHDF